MVKKKPKQRAIKFFLDNTYIEGNFPIDRNLLKDGLNQVDFRPKNVFHERKPKRVFWRKPKHLIMFVDGAIKAIGFTEKADGINPWWTMGEAKEFVNKVMAKALLKYKPMTWAQFIVILIPVVIILVLLIKMAMHVGAL